MSERRTSETLGAAKAPREVPFPPFQATPIHRRLLVNLRPIWLQGLFLYLLLVFTILYSLFIHRVLVQGNPIIGGSVFDASTTNLLLSVFSQLYATLIGFVVKGLLDALRWPLAARDRRRRGTRAATFLQLSSATDWFSTCVVVLALKLRTPTGLVKLAIPFMILGFGSILKVQNNFEDDFIFQGPTVDVFAGTIPLDTTSLRVIPTVYVTGFFDTWMQALLNYQRFVTAWPIPGCGDGGGGGGGGGGCKSFILPGSLEQVRRMTSSAFLNETIFQGGTFSAVDAIRIASAPAIALTFDTVPAEIDFDLETDCTIYAKERKDGLQFCRKQVGDSIAVGWKACPGSLLVFGLCDREDLWTRSPLRTKTMMSAFHQTVTTTYSQRDLTIKDVRADSAMTPLPIPLADHEQVWDRLFVLASNATEDDRASVATFLYRVPWLHRTYTEFYPDNNVIHREHLHNFLAINMQFAVSAVEYASYKDFLSGVRHELPREMRTTASGGRTIQRIVAQPWTALTFIVTGCVVTALSLAGFAWILWQAEPVPNATGILEWDMVERIAGGAPRPGPETMTLIELFEGMTLEERSSAWQVARALRDRRLQLVPASRPASFEDERGVAADRVLVVLRNESDVPGRVDVSDGGLSSRATTFAVDEDGPEAKSLPYSVDVHLAEATAEEAGERLETLEKRPTNCDT